MGSPSLLLMPCRAPVGSPGAPTSAALLWAQGRRTTGAEQAGGLHGQNARLCSA